MLDMMKKNLFTGLVLLATLIVFTGCDVTDTEDELAPQVLAVYPVDAAEGIATDTSIVITFDMPMDTASCEERFYAYEIGRASCRERV